MWCFNVLMEQEVLSVIVLSVMLLSNLKFGLPNEQAIPPVDQTNWERKGVTHQDRGRDTELDHKMIFWVSLLQSFLYFLSLIVRQWLSTMSLIRMMTMNEPRLRWRNIWLRRVMLGRNSQTHRSFYSNDLNDDFQEANSGSSLSSQQVWILGRDVWLSDFSEPQKFLEFPGRVWNPRSLIKTKCNSIYRLYLLNTTLNIRNQTRQAPRCFFVSKHYTRLLHNAPKVNDPREFALWPLVWNLTIWQDPQSKIVVERECSVQTSETENEKWLATFDWVQVTDSSHSHRNSIAQRRA